LPLNPRIGIAIVTSFAVLLGATGCGGKSFSDQVSAVSGSAGGVHCDKIGVMAVAGAQDVVYFCSDTVLPALGCFADTKAGPIDVSDQWDTLNDSTTCSTGP